jgi:hypothetical protein
VCHYLSQDKIEVENKVIQAAGIGAAIVEIKTIQRILSI